MEAAPTHNLLTFLHVFRTEYEAVNEQKCEIQYETEYETQVENVCKTAYDTKCEVRIIIILLIINIFHHWYKYISYFHFQTIYSTVEEQDCQVIEEEKCESRYETIYENKCETVYDTKVCLQSS